MSIIRISEFSKNELISFSLLSLSLSSLQTKRRFRRIGRLHYRVNITSVELEIFVIVALLALEARLGAEFTPIIRHSWIALFNFVLKEMTFDKPVYLPRVHSNDYLDQFSQKYSESESVGYSEKSLLGQKTLSEKSSVTKSGTGISNSMWEVTRDVRDCSLKPVHAQAMVKESCAVLNTDVCARSDLVVEEI